MACLTEDAAIQLHRGKCSFFVESPLLHNGRNFTAIQVKMIALRVPLNVDGDPYIKPSVVGNFLLVVCS